MLKTLDVGCGPIDSVVLPSGVDMHFCDRRDFDDPLVEFQNMEAMTYADNFFDVVYCINALDHTPNAKVAVKEMIRVCRPGGLVYIDCALIQRTTSGRNHAWDAEENGTFSSKDDEFDLKDFGFSIEFINNGGERRYDHMIARKIC